MKKILIIVLTTALVLGLIGCSKSGDADKIGIRGEITNLSLGQDDSITFIMVEGKLESDTAHDKASVTITDKTKVMNKSSKKRLSKDDLMEGLRVEVIFEGPVRESYPVQADAKEIWILD